MTSKKHSDASTSDLSDVQQSTKEFRCGRNDCNKTYYSIYHLRRHEKNVHSGKLYICRECGEFFTSQYNQKRHIDNIHLLKNPKKYQCDYCELSFNKKSWLTRHLFRHTGIKPYMCTFENCEATFIVPSKLKRHMKVHEGYTCPKENCNEKFTKWTEVRRHLKIVHPKVYKCPECEQEFSRSNNLKAHLVIHDSNRHLFMCPRKFCDRFYSTRSNLDHHIKSYHEKRPFNCAFERCSKAFKSQEDLEAHVAKHSPSGRLRKKKKKQKHKVSFAAELAGLVPKKWQIDVLKGTYKPPDANKSTECPSDSTSMEDDSESQLESSVGNEEVLPSSVVKNSADVSNSASHKEMVIDAVNLDINADGSVESEDIIENLEVLPENSVGDEEVLPSSVVKNSADVSHLASDEEMVIDVVNLNINAHDSVENEDIIEKFEVLPSNAVESCNDKEISNNVVNMNINSDDSDYSIENDDIRILLNIIEKRTDFENESVMQETKCISI